MKRWKLGIFLLLIMAVFTACANKTTTKSKTTNDLAPEQTVQAAFDAVMQKDYDKFNQYVENSNIFFNVDINSSDQLTDTEKNIMNELFSNFSYEISSTQIDGSKATVNVKMTNTDFSDVIADLVKQSLNSILSDDEEEDDSVELLLNLLTEANKNNSKTSSDLELQLNKKVTGWKIDLNYKARNILLGNLVDILGK